MRGSNDDDGERGDDPGRFSSALVLGPGAWRQFVTEGLALLAGLVGLVIGGSLMWGWRSRPEALLLGVIYTGWCLYVMGGSAKRLRQRRAVLGSGIPTLQLDDLGARVRHPRGNLDGAFLAWVDCAAVVVSRVPTGGRTPDSHRAYVEFVPVSPDRVEGRARSSDQRQRVMERSADDVRLVWLEHTGVGRRAGDVTSWLRARRPELTVVDSLDRHSASTL